MMAWVLLGEGKRADAFALLDSTEKDSDARKLPWPAFQATARACKIQNSAGPDQDSGRLLD